MTITKQKNSFTLHASFLPIIVVALIILGAGYFLIGDDLKLPKLIKDGTEVRRLEGFPTVVNTTKQIEKKRVIITSEPELNEFLNTVDPSGLLMLTSKINFDKEYLVGVATETKSTSGFDLKIRRLYRDKNTNTLLVSIRETRPGKLCEIDTVDTVAVDLVAITKTDSKIDFERIKKIRECR